VIRELTAQDELFAHQVWPAQIRWALSQLNKQAAAARDAGLDHIPPEQGALYLRVYHQGVAVGLSRHPRTSRTAAQSDATNLLERLRDRAHQYLRFTETCTSRPPTTAPNATCAPSRPRSKSPAATNPRPAPPTG